jgi:hypothetical protein
MPPEYVTVIQGRSTKLVVRDLMAEPQAVTARVAKKGWFLD